MRPGVARCLMGLACAAWIASCGTAPQDSVNTVVEADGGSGTAQLDGGDAGAADRDAAWVDSVDAFVDGGADGGGQDGGPIDASPDGAAPGADAGQVWGGTGPDDDFDGDGVPNALDGDADNDGLYDFDEMRQPGTEHCVFDPDCDDDGLEDGVEGRFDTDGDSIPDMVDTDSDGDGVPDAEQFARARCFIAGEGPAVRNIHRADADEDGLPNVEDGQQDSDGDGTSDLCDTDSDGDGISDTEETDEGDGLARRDRDSDGDGVVDRRDTDSDDDGLPDGFEHPAPHHCGWWQWQPGGCYDRDLDGIDAMFDQDSDGDGTLDGDAWRPAPDGGGRVSDLDLDGVPDHLDLDDDGDQIPDVAETGCPGASEPRAADSDGDGWDDFWESAFGLPDGCACDASCHPGQLDVVRDTESWPSYWEFVVEVSPAADSCAGTRFDARVRTWPQLEDADCVQRGLQFRARTESTCEDAVLVDADGDSVEEAAVGFRAGDGLEAYVTRYHVESCTAALPGWKLITSWRTFVALTIDVFADGEVIATGRWASEDERSDDDF